MFSVPISMAVVALLTFLGVKLDAAQTAMVVAGTIVAVKIAIALGAATIVTKGWAALKGKKPEGLPSGTAPGPVASAPEQPETKS
jgi:hypothetical protein